MKDEIQKSLNALHFQQALNAIHTDTTLTSEQYHIYSSQALRALGKFHEALRHSQAVNTPASQLETAKNLFGTGEITQSIQLLDTIPTPQARLNLAGALAETGQVDKAANILDTLLPDRLSSLEKMDALLLKADIASFQEKEDLAIDTYHEALCQADTLVPANWIPLRKMLIYQNLADTYEQMEEGPLAIQCYKEGYRQLQLQTQTDPHITDLSSYQIEFLLSMANCYGNQDEFKQARHYLNLAAQIFKQNPPIQKDYFQARLAYITGLIAMNDDQEEIARQLFEQAFTLQKQLTAKYQDKPEHLARTAYYLASLTNDLNTKKQLYNIAIPIFEKVQAKEPTFYQSCLAETANELGRLEHDPHQLDKAIDLYEKLHHKDPDDLLTLTNLVIARINQANITGITSQTALKQELTQLKHIHAADLPVLIQAACHAIPTMQKWLEDFSDDLPALYEA